MRLDFDPSDTPARRAKAWAASVVLAFVAFAAVIIAWFLSVTYLMPAIGFGAVVLVATFAGLLSYGLGRVFDWLARG
jgi:membrane protein YdbS with pleckstrin-like domain